LFLPTLPTNIVDGNNDADEFFVFHISSLSLCFKNHCMKEIVLVFEVLEMILNIVQVSVATFAHFASADVSESGFFQ